MWPSALTGAAELSNLFTYALGGNANATRLDGTPGGLAVLLGSPFLTNVLARGGVVPILALGALAAEGSGEGAAFGLVSASNTAGVAAGVAAVAATAGVATEAVAGATAAEDEGATAAEDAAAVDGALPESRGRIVLAYCSRSTCAAFTCGNGSARDASSVSSFARSAALSCCARTRRSSA